MKTKETKNGQRRNQISNSAHEQPEQWWARLSPETGVKTVKTRVKVTIKELLRRV
jgi:hypothetical protein